MKKIDNFFCKQFIIFSLWITFFPNHNMKTIYVRLNRKCWLQFMLQAYPHVIRTTMSLIYFHHFRMKIFCIIIFIDKSNYAIFYIKSQQYFSFFLILDSLIIFWDSLLILWNILIRKTMFLEILCELSFFVFLLWRFNVFLSKNSDLFSEIRKREEKFFTAIKKM